MAKPQKLKDRGSWLKRVKYKLTKQLIRSEVNKIFRLSGAKIFSEISAEFAAEPGPPTNPIMSGRRRCCDNKCGDNTNQRSSDKRPVCVGGLSLERGQSLTTLNFLLRKSKGPKGHQILINIDTSNGDYLFRIILGRGGLGLGFF